ncbi:hypothetical protein LQ564_10615 [Massilia sp. G4R7]|uniref:Uncharacterized protein n=1 Tax=Massilia phyllostachyos TaxID=2898585 RepID=A0ABS8Q4T9_9BURK|nr:hypothetical protein [Massilia phyllostachyos]MCD2516760.1 hypothetical protein [Massilia phyllostachyos]
MKLKLWAAFAALSAAALVAQAQQSSRMPDPADPSVPVPATVYESVLTGPVPPTNGNQTPDKSWRPANDALAGQTGHAGHHSAAPAPTQVAPRQPAPVAPSKDQHQHH